MALPRTGPWLAAGRAVLRGVATPPWARSLTDLLERTDPQAVLAGLRARVGRAAARRAAAGVAPAKEGGEPEALSRRLGWELREWRPEAPGPVRFLACHCQALPDPVSPDPQPSSDRSAWRFEVMVETTAGRSFVVVGRLDRTQLRLLLRSTDPLSERERARLSEVVGRLRLADGQRAVLNFDPVAKGSGRAGARAVDRRA
ncbi:MAG: hypothetical protein KDC18_09215 [Alphaproteobacteria bacterium]|nr:hypothetical protein [Alphaproteobacteria bacterium]MCB9928770.1 hypothetical protein [Alphaproteobacteria bacterium]